MGKRQGKRQVERLGDEEGTPDRFAQILHLTILSIVVSYYDEL